MTINNTANIANNNNNEALANNEQQKQKARKNRAAHLKEQTPKTRLKQQTKADSSLFLEDLQAEDLQEDNVDLLLYKQWINGQTVFLKPSLQWAFVQLSNRFGDSDFNEFDFEHELSHALEEYNAQQLIQSAIKSVENEWDGLSLGFTAGWVRRRNPIGLSFKQYKKIVSHYAIAEMAGCKNPNSVLCRSIPTGFLGYLATQLTSFELKGLLKWVKKNASKESFPKDSINRLKDACAVWVHAPNVPKNVAVKLHRSGFGNDWKSLFILNKIWKQEEKEQQSFFQMEESIQERVWKRYSEEAPAHKRAIRKAQLVNKKIEEIKDTVVPAVVYLAHGLYHAEYKHYENFFFEVSSKLPNITFDALLVSLQEEEAQAELEAAELYEDVVEQHEEEEGAHSLLNFVPEDKKDKSFVEQALKYFYAEEGEKKGKAAFWMLDYLDYKRKFCRDMQDAVAEDFTTPYQRNDYYYPQKDFLRLILKLEKGVSDFIHSLKEEDHPTWTPQVDENRVYNVSYNQDTVFLLSAAPDPEEKKFLPENLVSNKAVWATRLGTMNRFGEYIHWLEVSLENATEGEFQMGSWNAASEWQEDYGINPGYHEAEAWNIRASMIKQVHLTKGGQQLFTFDWKGYAPIQGETAWIDINARSGNWTVIFSDGKTVLGEEGWAELVAYSMGEAKDEEQEQEEKMNKLRLFLIRMVMILIALFRSRGNSPINAGWKWMLHFLLGSGKDKTLPNEWVEPWLPQIKGKANEQGQFIFTSADWSGMGGGFWTKPHGFYCVGGFSGTVSNGVVEFEDVYDWHPMHRPSPNSKGDAYLWCYTQMDLPKIQEKIKTSGITKKLPKPLKNLVERYIPSTIYIQIDISEYAAKLLGKYYSYSRFFGFWGLSNKLFYDLEQVGCKGFITKYKSKE